MRVLGIIPARGGSKEVLHKNLRKIRGKELIVYSIDTGLACPGISQLIVSTDDEEIAEVSRNAGATVPFLRPAELAGDHSPTIDCIIHAVEFLQKQGEAFDIVCLLQPTTPFRSVADIEKALLCFKASDADSLISVRKVPHTYNPHWTFSKGVSNYLSISTGEQEIISRRQDLPEAYHRDGAIYLTRMEILTVQKSLFGRKILGYEMTSSPYINIDTWEDLTVAAEYAAKYAT